MASHSKILKTIFIGCLIYGIGACSSDDFVKEIKLDETDTELQQVLYAKISVGDTSIRIRSYVSATLSSNDSIAKETSPDFIVKINGVSIANTATSGFIGKTAPVKASDRIEILSKLKAYPDAYVGISMPAKPKLIKSTFIPSGTIDRDGQDRSQVSMIFDTTEITSLEIQLFNKNNSTIRLESLDKNSADALLSGSIIFDMTLSDKANILFGPLNTLSGTKLKIYNITRDYYQWSKKAENIKDTESLPFSTPFDQHTNIRGGLGLVYGVNELLVKF
jgi:hypothetical protein